MAKYNIEVQDENGNIYHPHTNSTVVLTSSGQTVEAALANKANKEQTQSVTPICTQGYACRAGGYYKDEFGVVHLDCWIEASSGSFIHLDPVLNLPTGFRPERTYLDSSVLNDDGKRNVFPVWVDSNGNISYSDKSNLTVKGFAHADIHISFFAE